MLEDEDYVYFFLREQAVEYINCGKVVIMMMVMRKSDADVDNNDDGGDDENDDDEDGNDERHIARVDRAFDL